MNNIKIIFWLIFFSLLYFFLREISSILSPFIASMIIAYFLNPLTLKLEKIGIKRTYTVSIIVGGFFLCVGGGMIKVAPTLFDQVKQFILTVPKYQEYVSSNILPKLEIFISKVSPKLAVDIKSRLAMVSSSFFDHILLIIRNIFDSSIAIFNIIALILFTPILVFYLLRDWPSIIKNVEKLVPLTRKKLIFEQLKQVDVVLSAYVRGQINVCFILSFFYVVALSILGLNYFLLMGIITGFLTIIPYLGLMISCLICSLIALLQFSDMYYVYITFGIFILGYLLESYFLTPKIVGEKVGLHPVWIIFSLMSGGAIFGFWGMFFSIPIAAIVGVLIRSTIKWYLASHIYKK